MTLLLPVLLACAPKHPQVRDRGLTPASSTRDILAEQMEPRRYAVLVGVDSYEDPAFPPLRHAGADAEALAEALRTPRTGGFDEVILLTDATRREWANALIELRERVRREDSVLLYFSGHGTRVADEGAWRRFLLLRDSRSGDLDGTSFDLEDLQRFLGTLRATRRGLVVDACFHGDGKSVARPSTLDPDSPPAEEPLAPNPAALGLGEAYLYATSAGRPAREDDSLGHGVYTWFLLEGMGWGFKEADLDEDGVLSAYELHDYARSRTIERTEAVQQPEASFRVVGEADLLLAGDPERRRAAERALIYLYARSLNDATLVVDGRDRGALPGSVVVPPGKHHVVLRDKEGDAVIEGFATLKSGRAYRIDELKRVVHGPRRMLALRSNGLVLPRLAEVLGSGALGGELALAGRADRGALRGLMGELRIGGGASPNREFEAQTVANARPVVWTGSAVGWQTDLARIRIRAAWGATLLVTPPDRIDAGTSFAEAGVWLLGMGPELAAGLTIPGGWTVMGGARLHSPWLDTNQDGSGELAVFPSTHLGVEASF